MAWLDSILPRNIKLSSINEEQLLRRRASLADCLALARAVERDLEGQLGRLGTLEITGVAVILTGLVSDILLDTVGETLGKAHPVANRVFAQIYGQAKKRQWAGNRYAREIGLIKDNAAHLETLARADPTGMWKMVVTVHKNMVANAIGLLGHIEDTREARQAAMQSIKTIKKQIRALEASEDNVDFYLRSGAPAGREQRSTPASPPASRMH